MRCLSTVLVLQLVLLPVLSYATPTPLPTGKRVTCQGETYLGYTLEEVKTLLRIHANYVAWSKQLTLTKELNGHLEEKVNSMNGQIGLLQFEVTELKADRDRLSKKWEEENRLRHLAENKPAFGNWLAWGVAAVTTTVAAVLSVVLIARK